MEMMYKSKYGTLGVYDLGNHYKIKDEREDIGAIYIYLFNRKIDLLISDIANWKYDDDFIILIKYPSESFKCYDRETKDYTRGEFVYLWSLEYIIIDKKTNKIYVTDDENKFLEKCKELNVKIYFLQNEKFKVDRSGSLDIVYKNSTKYQDLNKYCIKKDDNKNMFYY
jgi:hypothetical protein